MTSLHRNYLFIITYFEGCSTNISNNISFVLDWNTYATKWTYLPYGVTYVFKSFIIHETVGSELHSRIADYREHSVAAMGAKWRHCSTLY